MLRLTDEQLRELCEGVDTGPPYPRATERETAILDGLVVLGLMQLVDLNSDGLDEFVTNERGQKEVELQLLARTVQL